MKIVIEGRPISKKNHRRNFGHTSLPSVAYAKFQQHALWQLKGLKEKFNGEVIVNYIFYMKGRLDTDCDNMIGGVNDILQDAGIIDNDKNIIAGSFRKIPGNKDWKTILEIDYPTSTT
jgi:Holliday junction resolvase RusA-like endonuclease